MGISGSKKTNKQWPAGETSVKNHWAPDIHPWFHEYIAPIYTGLWHADEALAQEKLDVARKAISDGTMDGETADCLSAQLTYVSYQLEQMRLRNDPQGLSGEQINARLVRFIKDTLVPTEGLQGQECYQYQVRLYILACCSSTFSPPLLDETAFNSWLDKLETKYRNTEFWNYVACWAYTENYLPPLEQAYEYMITQGAGFLSEYAFKRAELMLRLRRSLATDEDLIELMKLSTVSNQLKVTKSIFIEEATRQKLWTVEVERFYEDFLLELSHNTTKRAERLTGKGEKAE